MNKHILTILIALFSGLPVLLHAQRNCSVSGTVRDSTMKPVDIATIALHSLPDSAVVKTGLSDSAGTFVLEGLKEGLYFVEIFAMDYAIAKGPAITLSAADPNVRLAPVILKRTQNDLKEVQVTARKALVVHKADRTVVNVDALLSAAGGTALDVLEKSPGLQVDQNGTISMRGKQGVTIYIDDRPAYLSGADLVNYLKSLPASALDQVELMPNPPANYDAAGNAGVINIKMKKNNVKGFNGSLSLSVNQGVMTRSNNSVNLNYRHNKISAYTNISYGVNSGFSNLDLYRTYKNTDNTPNTYFEQNTYFHNNGQYANLLAGVDYYQSEKTTIGVILTGMGHVSTNVNDNTANLLNNLHQLDSVIVAHNSEEARFTNAGANLNYRRKFNKDAKLTADADYLIYRNNTNQVNRNTGYLPPRIFQSEDTLRGKLPGSIDIYSLKADYTRPGTFKFTFSTGIKTSLTQTDNRADYTLYTPNTVQTDYDKSNHFLYRENINAAYVNLNREIGKLSVQAGLRLENTVSGGHQMGNALKPDSSFTRNYTNLFPTAYLTYKFDSQATHQLGLNYGRRIDRPYYQDLNPFVSPMDKFTYYTGNPFLKPALNHTIQLSHTYKNKLTTTLSYSHSKDNVDETIRIQNGIYYSMPGNIGSKTNITLGVDGDLDITKWLNVHGYSEVCNIISKSAFYTGTLYTNGTYWFVVGSLRASPGKGWDLMADGYYQTRAYNAQFIIQSQWRANAAVQKKLTQKATLKLALNDIFYSSNIRGTIGNLVQADAGWVNRHDSRNVSLTFSYRFGKAIKGQEKYDATGADAEKNRVKN